MLQVGLKYCGGCQEHYDRITGARSIQAGCRDCAVFSPAQENVIYDLLLVICGCTVLCPDTQNLRAKYGSITVCGPEDLNDAIQRIKLLYSQEEKT